MVIRTDPEDAAEEADDVPEAYDVYEPDEEIPIGELFDDEFVSAHTDFETFDEMVAASLSDASSADGLTRVPDGAWAAFVAERTDFENEQEMVFAARDHWVATRLGL